MVEEVSCLRQTGGIVGILVGMPNQSVSNAVGAGAAAAAAPGNPATVAGAVTATVASHHQQQQQQQQHQHQQQQQQQHHHHQQQQQHLHQQQQQHHLASNMSMLTVKGGGGGSRYLWTDRELLMHLQNYTPLILLIDFVEKTRTKRFYESSERYEILMLVFIMRKGAPFCENKRFPAEYWVNLSVGPIAEAFDRLSLRVCVVLAEKTYIVN